MMTSVAPAAASLAKGERESGGEQRRTSTDVNINSQYKIKKKREAKRSLSAMPRNEYDQAMTQFVAGRERRGNERKGERKINVYGWMVKKTTPLVGKKKERRGRSAWV